MKWASAISQDLDLEQALEFIEDDELVEVTPSAIRLRKKLLKEHERKKKARTSSVKHENHL